MLFQEKLYRHQEHDCYHTADSHPLTDLKKDYFGEISPENRLCYQIYSKSLRVSLIVYADFEFVLMTTNTCTKPSNIL